MEFIEETHKINEVEKIKEIFHEKSEEIPKILIWGFAKMIFDNGHIHCDPHPGNILVRWNPNNLTRP